MDIIFDIIHFAGWSSQLPSSRVIFISQSVISNNQQDHCCLFDCLTYHV